MLDIIPSNQFKKDLKLASKRGFKVNNLTKVVNTLQVIAKLAELVRNPYCIQG